MEQDHLNSSFPGGGVALGDVASDAGNLNGDFIASDMAATTHYKQKMDMDEEGWFLETPTPRQSKRNAVYLDTRTPRFLEVAQMAGLASTDWTWTVRIADFDNDGSRSDLFTTLNSNLDDVALFSDAFGKAQIQSIMGGDFSAFGVGDRGDSLRLGVSKNGANLVFEWKSLDLETIFAIPSKVLTLNSVY